MYSGKNDFKNSLSAINRIYPVWLQVIVLFGLGAHPFFFYNVPFSFNLRVIFENGSPEFFIVLLIMGICILFFICVLNFIYHKSWSRSLIVRETCLEVNYGEVRINYSEVLKVVVEKKYCFLTIFYGTEHSPKTISFLLRPGTIRHLLQDVVLNDKRLNEII